MRGGEVIRTARERALMDIPELAERLGVTAGQLTGWESGDSEPTFSQVDAAVSATGHDLATVLAVPEIDPHDRSLLDVTQTMTVQERVAATVRYARVVQEARRLEAT